MPFDPDPDVIIAGAGPVGLLLAGELKRGGASVLVLEREAYAGSPLKEMPFGLRGLTLPSIDALDRRGLLDALCDAAPGAKAAHWAGQPRRPAGHFAGIPIFADRINPAAAPGADRGPLPVTMAALEAVLAANATALGACIRRGAGVDAVSQDDHGVTVHAGSDAFRARWLVGCDGGRSTVRKAVGIGFSGTSPEFTGYSLQVRLADPALLAPGRHSCVGGTITVAAPGALAIIECAGGAGHRAGPLDAAAAEGLLRRVSGLPIEVVALELASTWTDRAMLADAYRRGRVLLAGDAAHVHSPLGGQGLNLGIGDALDLGLKLAAVVQGDASAGLLDRYGDERRPVAAAVLNWSRAQVALMRSDPGTAALREVVRALADTCDGATWLAARMSGVRRAKGNAG